MNRQRIKIVQLSTVHSRSDTRIALKQCATLGRAFPGSVHLVVADGVGEERRIGVQVVDLGALQSARLARALKGFARSVSYLFRTRPRIVHFHDPELIPVGLVAKALGMRVIYDVHEDVPRQILGRPSMPKAARRVLAASAAVAEWVAAQVFDAIVPATPSIAKRFAPEKTVLVQNFPLLSELTTVEGRPYAERAPRFVYVGWISRLRGAVEMVDAVGRLGRRSEAELQLAGTFSPESLLKEVERCSGFHRTRMLGWLNRAQVAELLGTASAGLVLFHPAPNHVDAQPNKLFEYMSAGLPVIASDFPLWRQIVDGTGCGLLVDPTDPDAIAEAMSWILENTQEAEAMGRRGREAVEAQFNWVTEGEKLVALYRKLAGQELGAVTQ